MSGKKNHGFSAIPVFVGVLLMLVAWYPHWSLVRAITLGPGLTQVVAFPLVSGLVLVAVAAAIVLAAPKAANSGHVALTLTGWATVLSMLLAGIGFLVSPTGISPLGVAPDPVRPTGLTRTVRVVTWNSGDDMGPGDLARLLREQSPDVVVLPETRAEDVKELGKDFQVVQSPATGRTAPTTVAVRKSLGEYRQVAGPRTEFGAVALEPVKDTSLPRVIGVHSAPMSWTRSGVWYEDLKAVTHAVEAAPGPTILAGDLGATLRHGALADRERAVDVMQVAGKTREGTWPRDWPGWTASQVDHVLVTGPVDVESAGTVDMGVSDHMLLSTTLRLPKPTR